jgi:hypothetical protein
MKTYKIIYAHDKILLCIESSAQLPEDVDVRYEESKGHLIYAFVKAENRSEAKEKARRIVPKLVPQRVASNGKDSPQ